MSLAVVSLPIMVMVALAIVPSRTLGGEADRSRATTKDSMFSLSESLRSEMFRHWRRSESAVKVRGKTPPS